MHCSFFQLFITPSYFSYSNLEWDEDVILGLDGDFSVRPPYMPDDVRGNDISVQRIRKVVSSFQEFQLINRVQRLYCFQSNFLVIRESKFDTHHVSPQVEKFHADSIKK